MNLAGFYALAQAFQGIEVCVTPWQGGVNFHDANSGFTIKHGGYQYLSPPQALAFVRERDNLPNGDLDRTHRQQAVIDYVIWKLAPGVLTDLGQLNSLLDVAKQYVITDADWDLPLFATEMHALTGKNFSSDGEDRRVPESTDRPPTPSTSPRFSGRCGRRSPARRVVRRQARHGEEHGTGPAAPAATARRPGTTARLPGR